MPPNRASLAKIHIATKELGIDDDVYRDLLRWKFGVESAKDLTPRQVTVLLNHFRAKGWQPKTKKVSGVSQARLPDNYRKIKPGPAASQQRYVLALWNNLGYEIKKLDARCKKQFGVDRIEWVSDHEQLHILITDLKKRCKSAGAPDA